MPAIASSAPGKIILFGEHAVVYGRPALAVPVHSVQARAVVRAMPLAPQGSVQIEAPDIGLSAELNELPEDHPLAATVHGVQKHFGVRRIPACKILITSTIPVASGLGSGAAVSIAVARAVSNFLGHPLDDDRISSLAFEIEKLHHGTPSGVDNTVITYDLPVFFIKGSPNLIQPFHVALPFTLLIGDTGIASPTSSTVADVRKGWEAEPARFEAYFDQVGEITRQAREKIETGQPERLGELMDANHALLEEMGVSSPALDHLIRVAREAGALGAKLSGGGRGGNMIALVGPENASRIQEALKSAGARQVLMTEVGAVS